MCIRQSYRAAAGRSGKTVAAVATAIGLLAATTTAAGAQSAPAAAESAQAQPAVPAYVVVQGETSLGRTPRQQITVLCPSTHRALGVGYVALLPGPQAPDGTATWRDTMLDAVRTMPDSAGTGFLVEGLVNEVERTGVEWRLVVRVVCARVGA